MRNTPLIAAKTGPVGLMYKVEIHDDASMDDVYQLTEEMRQQAESQDGTLLWELSIAGRAAYGYERYRDTEAFKAHLADLAPLFPRIGPLWKTTMMVPTTPLSPEVTEMLSGFGATIPDGNAGIEG